MQTQNETKQGCFITSGRRQELHLKVQRDVSGRPPGRCHNFKCLFLSYHNFNIHKEKWTDGKREKKSTYVLGFYTTLSTTNKTNRNTFYHSMEM